MRVQRYGIPEIPLPKPSASRGTGMVFERGGSRDEIIWSRNDENLQSMDLELLFNSEDLRAQLRHRLSLSFRLLRP